MAIVLLGEGDFSFSCNASFNEPIYATTYESEEETLKHYPDVGARLKSLQSRGSHTLFGVDAMHLSTESRLPKARLYRWNCPCPGWGGSMQRVLELLFQACRTTLTSDGAVELLYTKSQSATVLKDLCLAARVHNFSPPKGRPFEGVSGYAGKYCDSSELLDMAEATIWSVQYRGDDAGEYIYPTLPSEVLKRVIAPAGVDEWLQPERGDEVVIRMKAGAEPKTVLLGADALPEGLVEGISTMRTGEVAQFVLPCSDVKNAEVELVSWTRRVDLFGDGAAIKWILEHGGYWEWMPPHDGYEVIVSVRITGPDGTVHADVCELAHIIGSNPPAVPCGEVLDKALLGMRRKERAAVLCTGGRAPMVHGTKLEGATVDITLHEWRLVVDVSPSKDGSSLAKLRRCERTWRSPGPDESVRVVVDSATDGANPLPGFEGPRELRDTTVSDRDLCEGLRRVLAAMKLGENAIIVSSSPEMFSDRRLGISASSAKNVVLQLQLLEPEQGNKRGSDAEDAISGTKQKKS